MIAMIGTSDRLCWLAETCKILLLLLATAEGGASSSGPWTVCTGGSHLRCELG